ncbi:regulatory protein RecX [Bacteroidota bacterium]
MKVNRISKKDSANVIIEFDDGEPLFLSVEIFMKSGLRINDEISEDRFLLFVKENRIFHIKQRAFRYLGRRLHSKSELRVKLLQKGYESELINEVLNELENKDYLNDAEFVKTFADEKIKRKHWGEKKLRAELLKRGINSDILANVLSEVISDKDNYNNALIVAEKKLASLRNRKLDSASIKLKLSTFLNSRGFNYDVIKEVCENILNYNNSQD